MKNALFWALCLCPYAIFGQFYDDFTNGLSSWSGDTSKFEIDDDGRLRLDDNAGGTSSIYRVVEQLDTNIWSGKIKLEFQPSNSNQLRLIFQSSDTSNANAWYAEIGASGRTDSLRFYGVENGQEDFLGSMYIKAFSGDDVNFDYLINGEANETTIILSDTLTDADTLTLPSDFMLSTPFIFEIQCQYTSTRATKFAFDDIAVGRLKIDTTPVEIVNIDAITSTIVLIQFSEPVDTSSLGRIQMIGTNTADKISFSNDAQSLQVMTTDPMVSGQWYEILLESVSDLHGNVSDTLSGRFQYKEVTTAGAYDVLITELMADPQPVRAMPDCEYVELYNRTDHYIQLADFTIADKTRQTFLPEYLLGPQEFVVLCDHSCLDALSLHGNAIVVDDLPSLNNDADAISLVDFAGRIVHQVNYDRSWYNDDDRSMGGWSLEMVDTEDACAGKTNWQVADYEACGSPGAANSVLGHGKRDSLTIDQAFAISGNKVMVSFSHELLPDPDHLKIEMSHQVAIDRVLLEENNIEITLLDSLQPGTGYELKISDVRDCLNRTQMEGFEATIYLPKAVDSSQLVINEVLFDGYSERPEFIELHNPTSSFLMVDRMCLECMSSTDTTFECLEYPIIIGSESFLVWTEDTALLSKQYSREGVWLQASAAQIA